MRSRLLRARLAAHVLVLCCWPRLSCVSHVSRAGYVGRPACVGCVGRLARVGPLNHITRLGRAGMDVQVSHIADGPSEALGGEQATWKPFVCV